MVIALSRLRLALRSLIKAPGFSVAAMLTLAICFGANLTIFAVVDAILLRPLPFPGAGRLVTLYNTYPKAGVEDDGASIANYYERRGQLAAFQGLSIYREGRVVVGEPGATQQEEITQISPDFLATLGTNLHMGRAFSESETMPGADDAVILSNTYWQHRFGGEPGAIGQTLRIGGVPKKVVGILPPGFRFLSSKAQLYVPFTSRPESRVSRDRHSGGGAIRMIARLGNGTSLEEAQSQVDAQNQALELENPQAAMMADVGFRTRLVPLHAFHVKAIRTTLILLQTGVFVLLLIGCVNLINLLLIRASHRAKECAIRLSLGATRGWIIGQVVVENLVLTLCGGVLGLGVGAAGIGALGRFGVERLPLGAQVSLNGRMVGAALAVAILTGFLLSLPIAWMNLRVHLADTLHAESRGGTASASAQGVRHGFIVAQIALAFVLLSGAGLLGLSLKRTMAVSPGFQSDHLLTGRLELSLRQYPSASAILDFHERLLKGIRQQPGVVAVGLISNAPLSGNDGKSAFKVAGHVLQPGETLRGHYGYYVAGDYFQSLGIPLKGGRFLETADSHRSERVCVVDEDFARAYWPKGLALGQRLFRGSQDAPSDEAFTVVGVVGAVKQKALTEHQAQGAVYFPYLVNADSTAFVVTRTMLRPEGLVPTLLKTLRNLDSELAFADLQTMDARIADSLVAQRSPALLIGIFASVALLLAALGTYGVLSYATLQRRREIGIRMALGAVPRQILAQFLRMGGRLSIAGLALGLLGAWAMSRGMESTLFGVEAMNPGLLAAAGGLLFAVVLLASAVPAFRMAGIDPAIALRSE